MRPGIRALPADRVENVGRTEVDQRVLPRGTAFRVLVHGEDVEGDLRAFREHHQGKRGAHLLCTATITPRKRVLEMARSAVLARVKIRFLGEPYSAEDPYFRQFMVTIRESAGWVEYGGGVTDRDRLAEEYRAARGFILLSAMESQSLSALEAAACGCPLLLSELPWAKVSFGTQASYAPVASPIITAPFLKNFYNTIDEAPRVQKVLSWREVAEQLKGIYREAMTSR